MTSEPAPVDATDALLPVFDAALAALDTAAVIVDDDGRAHASQVRFDTGCCLCPYTEGSAPGLGSRGLNRTFTRRCGPRTRCPARRGVVGGLLAGATRAMRLEPLTAAGLSPTGAPSTRGRGLVLERARRCPGRGGEWSLPKTLHIFDFKCDRCQLLSNIACDVA